MERRTRLGIVGLALGGPLVVATDSRAHRAGVAGAVQPPAALKGPDPTPHVNDIEKYPTCNYCGMD
jgi:hypothetical protein